MPLGMEETWPPAGYGRPEQIETNERHVLATALLTTIPVGVVTVPRMAETPEAIFHTVGQFLSNTALAGHSTAFWIAQTLGFAALFFAWTVVAYGPSVPVHEGIHYALGSLYRFEQRFEIVENMKTPTPAVTVLTSGVPAGRMAYVAVAPWICISFITCTIMLTTDGLLRHSAALVLLLNTASSASDIYHTVLFATLPNGAVIAHREEGDDVWTECAVPR